MAGTAAWGANVGAGWAVGVARVAACGDASVASIKLSVGVLPCAVGRPGGACASDVGAVLIGAEGKETLHCVSVRSASSVKSLSSILREL